MSQNNPHFVVKNPRRCFQLLALSPFAVTASSANTRMRVPFLLQCLCHLLGFSQLFDDTLKCRELVSSLVSLLPIFMWRISPLQGAINIWFSVGLRATPWLWFPQVNLGEYLLSCVVFMCSHPNDSRDPWCEASVLSSHSSVSSLQLFNEVTQAEVTLQNSGKIGFTYVVLSPSTGTADSPLPGVPLALPSTVSTEGARVINPGPVSGCPGLE